MLTTVGVTLAALLVAITLALVLVRARRARPRRVTLQRVRAAAQRAFKEDRLEPEERRRAQEEYYRLLKAYQRTLDDQDREERRQLEAQKRRAQEKRRGARKERKRKERPPRPARTEPSGKAELWRWLGLIVGGTVLPFVVLGLAYWLAAGHFPSSVALLGRGDLFIPASIMNVEAVWLLSYIALPGRSVWFPIVLATCGLAALGGAICYGITAALYSAPRSRVDVSQTTLHELAKTVAILSASEFFLALAVGTIGAVLFILARRGEGSTA